MVYVKTILPRSETRALASRLPLCKANDEAGHRGSRAPGHEGDALDAVDGRSHKGIYRVLDLTERRLISGGSGFS